MMCRRICCLGGTTELSEHQAHNIKYIMPKKRLSTPIIRRRDKQLRSELHSGRSPVAYEYLYARVQLVAEHCL